MQTFSMDLFVASIFDMDVRDGFIYILRVARVPLLYGISDTQCAAVEYVQGSNYS